jgi:hypothetical protein
VQRLFRSAHDASLLLSPFQGTSDEKFFSCNIHSDTKRVDLNVKQDWLVNWRAAMKVADHTNSWSGSLFYNHPIWDKGLGLRNILLELSFDDFPPFEEKAQHSFGIVSVVPQNLSTRDKINCFYPRT